MVMGGRRTISKTALTPSTRTGAPSATELQDARASERLSSTEPVLSASLEEVLHLITSTDMCLSSDFGEWNDAADAGRRDRGLRDVGSVAAATTLLPEQEFGRESGFSGRVQELHSSACECDWDDGLLVCGRLLRRPALERTARIHSDGSFVQGLHRQISLLRHDLATTPPHHGGPLLRQSLLGAQEDRCGAMDHVGTVHASADERRAGSPMLIDTMGITVSGRELRLLTNDLAPTLRPTSSPDGRSGLLLLGRRLWRLQRVGSPGLLERKRSVRDLLRNLVR